MKTPVQWGILGTGDIARQMAEDLRHVPDAALRAVASRTPESAARFAHTHDIPVSYGDYRSLVQDPLIDVVYIATPHVRHCADALLCFEHGKAVLGEKPLALNRREVDRMIASAKEHDCFLMEAMWTAFFPAIQALRNDIKSGRIGTPQLLQADFSYRAQAAPESRLFNLVLGGGALLDIGIYTVALADMVFGEAPGSIATSWTAGPTGVDVSAAIILDYPGGGRAVLSTSLAYDAPQEATIVGDAGVLRIPHRFSQPDVYLREIGETHERVSFERVGYGYHLEAAAVTACVARGEKACDTVPWSASRRIMDTLDRIRAQWGLRYPGEEDILPAG